MIGVFDAAPHGSFVPPSEYPDRVLRRLSSGRLVGRRPVSLGSLAGAPAPLSRSDKPNGELAGPSGPAASAAPGTGTATEIALAEALDKRLPAVSGRTHTCGAPEGLPGGALVSTHGERTGLSSTACPPRDDERRDAAADAGRDRADAAAGVRALRRDAVPADFGRRRAAPAFHFSGSPCAGGGTTRPSSASTGLSITWLPTTSFWNLGRGTGGRDASTSGNIHAGASVETPLEP